MTQDNPNLTQALIEQLRAEITAEAVRALTAVAARFGHSFEFQSALLGGAAIDPTR